MVQVKQNSRHFFETLSGVDEIRSACTVYSCQSSIGFLTYLFPWLILSSLIQRGGESKTQSTNEHSVLCLASREIPCRGGILKAVVTIHGGEQIGTDSQLEGYSLIH